MLRLNKILLVDDDSISNFVAKSAIDKLKFADELIIKTDGKEGLSYLEEFCKPLNNYPDLILLDLKMPGMDGFAFLEEFELLCKKMRKEIIVVILTSSKDADDIIRLRRLGNYYLLNKPLTGEKLMDVYHRYFRDKKVLS
jgi:CheY-like chemotaxis protein